MDRAPKLPRQESGCRRCGWLPTLKEKLVRFDDLEYGGDRTVPESVEHREVHFVGEDEALETPIYDAGALHENYVRHGPAVITTENTTYLVERGWRVEPTPQGAVWLLNESASQGSPSSPIQQNDHDHHRIITADTRTLTPDP